MRKRGRAERQSCRSTGSAYLYDRNESVDIFCHALEDRLHVASCMRAYIGRRMNVSEECLVCRVDCQASTSVELSDSVIEQFGRGESAQVLWVPIVVCVFRIPANSNGGTVGYAPVDRVD
jgi:hypothetical protein